MKSSGLTAAAVKAKLRFKRSFKAELRFKRSFKAELRFNCLPLKAELRFDRSHKSLAQVRFFLEIFKAVGRLALKNFFQFSIPGTAEELTFSR